MFTGMVWLLALSYALNIRAHDWSSVAKVWLISQAKKIKTQAAAMATVVGKTDASNFKKVNFLSKKS
jgi:hypothetical protein